MESEYSTPGQPLTKKQRRHVSRACDTCKVKRAKCDGTQPCERCRSRRLQCTYDAPYLRGSKVPPARPSLELKEPSILTESPRNHVPEAGDQVNGEASRESTPHEAEGYLGQSSNLAYSQAARFELTSRPSSPPTGLDVSSTQAKEANGDQDQADTGKRVRHRPPNAGKKRALSSQSYLAFQERPFPPLNMACYSIPSAERGLEMSSWYFENASPTYRILHRPSVERMITTMCRSNEWLGGNGTQTDSSGGDESLDSVEECTVLMVWALACQYAVFPSGRKATTSAREWLQRKGREYYQVAEMTLEKDKTSLDKISTLQVRLLMCLYLLTTSRLKAAWDLFAIVKNMANNLDLSRLQSTAGHYSKSNLSPFNLELRKRAFWAIYTLDTYLCVMLGKSLTFDELEIRTPHPALDDELMSPKTRQHEYDAGVTHGVGLSLMLCPMAHANLARIVRKTLKSLYLGPRTDNDQLIVEALGAEMREWEFALPDFLRMRNVIGLRDIYARQNTVIRLAQQHALIMIYRPSLPLSGLAAKSAASSAAQTGFRDAASLRACQDACLQAALEAHSISASLFTKGEVNDHYWFTSYILFCAATVMLVHIAHNPDSMQAHVAWSAAQDCCRMERQVCQSNRLARRYVAALEDLSKQLKKRFPRDMSRILASAQRPASRPETVHRTASTDSQTHDHVLNQAPPFLYSGEPGMDDFNTSPASQWEQFLDPFLSNEESTSFYHWDSLVSGGMDFGFY
ncbi:hypothetical protein B9Z65_855 [Elsinoe australis]|uniref:Zn(2)-C6 fungal-type domain-containing protein n=1 Tax=Elsinoe australis TaxID=40998 RepID=A0A2P8AJQ4_9PEZI|nr:hypothetical protein B9Z65_855 [Elsinoe australis]